MRPAGLTSESSRSLSGGWRQELPSRLFLAPGLGRVSMDDLAREFGTSKKTIYRHFPDKHSLITAVLDRLFGAVERTLVAAAEETEGRPFGEQVQRFRYATCSELGRIGAAQREPGGRRGAAQARGTADGRSGLPTARRPVPARAAVDTTRTAQRDHPRRGASC
ncbi:TetR/AcrR family transcriptional regulator [Nocardia sp. R16R-3T]